MTYPSLPDTGEWLRAAREAIEGAGIPVERVSGGGTPTAKRTHELGVADELRVGTYVYGDRACIANGSVPLEDCALRVVATVVSRPTRDRAIIDAGSKTLTSDLAIDQTGLGQLVEHPEAAIYALNEEHGYVDVSACAAAARDRRARDGDPEPRLYDGQHARPGRPASRWRERRRRADSGPRQADLSTTGRAFCSRRNGVTHSSIGAREVLAAGPLRRAPPLSPRATRAIDSEEMNELVAVSEQSWWRSSWRPLVPARRLTDGRPTRRRSTHHPGGFSQRHKCGSTGRNRILGNRAMPDVHRPGSNKPSRRNATIVDRRGGWW